jgi:hypothetical protein
LHSGRKSEVKIVRLFFAELLGRCIAPSFGAVQQCRQIKVKADREACYDRQSKGLAEKRQAAGADKTKNPIP